MWLMYEHPEAKFEDMAMDFMDIRKKVYTFPQMGENTLWLSQHQLQELERFSNSIRNHHRC